MSKAVYHLLFLAFLSVARSTHTPVVDLGYAQYQGAFNASSNTTQFLGIRFAAPPTGSSRWKAPRAPKKMSGVQQANTQPPTCLQATFGGIPSSIIPPLPASEDCLFLNVWTPGVQKENHRRLPVVVWIHGGGYHAGGATGTLGSGPFNGEDLIHESGNQVVTVVIQYRLGLWGFLPGSEVKAGGVLNAGLLDQQYALRWVQQHISKFGGDPAKVTIWGESAGAGSVLQHLVANNGETHPPLFRAAISSSSFLPSQYHYNDTVPETLYSQVITQSNCSTTKNTLECLRLTDADILETINKNMAQSAFFGKFIWVPVVDGSLIVQRPSEAFKQGKVNSKFLLAVTNTFEGESFVNQTSTLTTPEFIADLFPEFGSEQISAATSQYDGLGTSAFQATAIMGESIFICPTYLMVQAFGNRSHKAEFAIPPGTHGSDVAYYFPSSTSGDAPPYNDMDFDKAFTQQFLDFAVSLDPNAKFEPTIMPTWNSWGENHTEMLFNETILGAPDVRPVQTSASLLERCSFWESVSEFTAQ